MLHTIKKVEYLEDYKLKLHFNDKSIKIVDLTNVLKRAKNMLLPLVEVAYFRQVKCDGTTIHWPNGVDLCPDVLYKLGKNITESKTKRKKPSITPKIHRRPKSITKQK
ncbi:MAG: DUF2442 domain-containing protein [Chlamydiota bacterium]